MWCSSLFRPLRMSFKGKRVLLGILCAILLIPLMGRHVAAQEPVIVIHEPVNGAMVQSQTIPLRAVVTAPEGTSLEQVQVWVNDAPERSWSKGVDPVLPGEVRRDIPLKQGENLIVVYAVNNLGQSAEQAVTVVYRPSRIRKPDLYILAIGVRDYAHNRLDLEYADTDAQAIVDVFRGQEGLLFTQVKTRLLLNEQASEDNIIDGLDWLLREVTQRDYVVIFVSGHGVRDELRGYYYFLPHDADPERVTRTGIPWSEFRDVLGKLVGRTLFLLDTCHAGGITGAKSVALDPVVIQDLTGAGQGVMYMASSTDDEISREDPAWGHGAFTKAILDGLLTGEADQDKTGTVYTDELDTYVTHRVKRLTSNAQRPTTDTSTGYTTFPLFMLSQRGEPTPTGELVEGTSKGDWSGGAPTATFTPIPPPDLPATATALAATLAAQLPPTDTPPPTVTDTPIPTETPTWTPTPDRAELICEPNRGTYGLQIFLKGDGFAPNSQVQIEAFGQTIAPQSDNTGQFMVIAYAPSDEAKFRRGEYTLTAKDTEGTSAETMFTLEAARTTDTPAPTLTRTATAAPCTNDATFVADVTIPDNTALEPGERFDKTWRVRNTGSCPWEPGYRFVFVSGDKMGASDSQMVDLVAAGGTAEITVPMTAPEEPGTYKGTWQMTDTSGERFGQTLTVVIQVRGAEATGDTWTRPADGMEMVYVPSGEFQMGRNDGAGDEKPVHTVALDGFWLDRTEVTNSQYRQCVAAGVCSASENEDDPRHNGDDQPVVYVDWNDAQRYCQWAGARLPTEAEWEYAARGPEGRVYPWGGTFDPNRANTRGQDDGYERTAPVGSYPGGASWVGALDMSGNVWEWVADWYGDYPSGKQVNPTGPATGDLKVLRGGSWVDSSLDVRGAFRYWNGLGRWFVSVGFRCARSS